MDHDDFVSLFADPEQLQLLLLTCPDGVVVTGPDSRVVLYTGGAEELFGFSPFDIIGKPLGRLFAEETEYAHLRRRLLEEGQLANLEMRAARRDRPPFPASLSAALLRDRYGEETGTILYVRDHTQLRHMEEQLRDRNRRLNSLVRQLDHIARHDQLTGMLRRGSAIDAAEAARAAATEEPAFGVALFDIDHFKRVNDTYGHAAGDEALAALANVISTAGRQQDIVGRYGGEEFIAFLPGADGRATAAFAERVRAAIAAAPVPVGNGHSVHVTISAGVSTVPDCAATLSGAMQIADERLLAAKRQGRNRIVSANTKKRRSAA